MLEVGNIKNEAILRDFLPKWPRTSAFCDFSSPCLQSNYCACHEKSEARSYEVLRLSRKVILLQNATPLRKSPPSPPNISDEHVSCTAPATRNASFQILFKCPTPAIVCGHAAKPSRFAHFWQGAQSLAPAMRNDTWTSKSAPYPYPSVFCTFDFEMCFAPQRRALFRHLNFQKWSEHGALCTFWLGNVRRIASRHNGVHFFDGATSKSAPMLQCFKLFHLHVCIAPHRRALFRHLNF